jgi:caffeoyl-CoA O-methyltransferase
VSTADRPDSTETSTATLDVGSLTPRPVTPSSIVAMRLEALSRQLDVVDSIDPQLKAELSEICRLASGLDPYLSECTTPESPALRTIAERTLAHDWSRRADDDRAATLEREMLSGHVEGQALKLLVHVTRAKRVLDIGMFTGYSALAMAEALPDDGEVIACEIDPDVADFAQNCFGESPSGHKIVVKIAPAIQTLHELATANESFDLVFIDADKAGYVGYLTTVLDGGLLAPHGVICVDNTLMQGQPYVSGEKTANGVAIAAFNKAVAAEPRVEQVLVPLRDGLTLIRRVDGGRGAPR